MAIKHIEQVELNGITYDMYVGIREIMQFEKLYRIETSNHKATFIKSLPLLQEADMTVLGCMLASMLHKEGKKQPVGWNVIEDLNIFAYLEELMTKLMNCISNDVIVESDPNDKGKQLDKETA